MGDFSNEPLTQVVKICCLVLAIFSLQLTVVGYFIVSMAVVERVIAALTCFIFFVYIYSSNILFLLLGILFAVTTLIWQTRKTKSSHSMVGG